jgi:hypothetical protein
MIPHEILKKIRQIELRTNRLVARSAERGCVRSTSRSTREFSSALGNSHTLRLGLRPQPRSGSVANRLVTESVAACTHLRIPTGFRPKAQGCEARATLGDVGLKSQPQRGCVRPASLAATPLALWGFRQVTQGCEERATLSHRAAKFANRNAAAALPVSSTTRVMCHNPVGVDENLFPFTQGSAYVATLGWRPEFLWDSRMAANTVCADSRITRLMIPHEILKKIRQIELRTNRIVTALVARGCARILRACLKKERGCVADQPPHAANAPTPRKCDASAAGRGRHRRAPGFFSQPLRGFRPKAQGCDAGATLGKPSNIIPTPTGLWQL